MHHSVNILRTTDIYGKWVNCMACELYLNKAVNKIELQEIITLKKKTTGNTLVT